MPDEVSTEEFDRKMREDHDWLYEHIDEFIEKYPGKIVAVDGCKLVAVGNDYSEVYRPYQEARAKIMPLVARIPHPDETAFFLI